MTVRRSARWVVLVLLLASCRGGSTAKTYTLSGLASGLLTPADVGSGWTQAERQTPTTTTTVAGSSTPTSPSSTALCPEAADNVSEFDRITARQNATMVVLTAPTSTQDRPVAVIENMWIVADPSAHFGRMKAAITACIGKTWTSASREQQTWAPITGLPKIGDDSISFLATAKVTTTSGVVERYVRTTVARFANVAVMLQGLDDHEISKSPTLTVVQLSTIFATAAAKIEHIAT